MLFVGASLSLLCGTVARAQQPDATSSRSDKRVVSVRASSAIEIDGSLDEPDWSRASAATGFIQNEPREGEPASEETEVRVLHDDQNLYVGLVAHDREPGRIIVTDLRKDFGGTDSDTFELVLDTFRDERNGYLFAINPAGAKSDAQMANEGREINRSWDGIWETRTRITEQGWCAEIRIPFRTLKFHSASEHVWGVNFLRRVRRRNEDSFWAPLPRIYELSRVSLAGTLEGLGGLRPGKDLRVKPYAAASFGETAGRPRTKDGDVGFDVKYGVSSGLTLDFTVNTDFAQVEADEQQINLSRFSLFFPEKRDFFLENSGVFQFGVARSVAGGGGGGGGRQDDAARNDVILFHSRQIGLSQNGNAIPILAGSRLSGRVGRYSVGALNVQQRAFEVAGRPAALPSANFTALRLRRDLLGSSDIGVMVLNKDTSGPADNRVVGVDGNFRFFQNFNVSANATKTFSPAGAMAGGEGRDTMLRSNLSYRGDVWEFRGSYTNVGERFNDEMGYVPRVGIAKTSAFISPHIRLRRWVDWFRETWPHWEISNVTRAGGGLDSRYYDYHWPFNFQDGSFAELAFQRTIEGLTSPFRINARRGVVIPAGEYAFNDYFVVYRSNPSVPFSYNVRYGLGDFYDGYRHTYQGGIGARVNEQLNITASYARNVIALPGGAFSTNLLSSRVVYSFSTNMFLNALLQYNTDARQWSSNVRFNIIHRPLSDIFVVYNEQRDSLTDALISRAVIGKITYMMAF